MFSFTFNVVLNVMHMLAILLNNHHIKYVKIEFFKVPIMFLLHVPITFSLLLNLLKIRPQAAIVEIY